MKKTLAVLLAALMLAAVLAGCGAKKEEAPSASLPNPVQEMSQADLAAALGVFLEAPEGAENAVWSAIDNTVAQLTFTLDGRDYFYRVQDSGDKTESFDISGLYYDWTETAEAEVAGRAAVVNTGEEAGFVQWLDIVPGLNYNLGCTGAVDAQTLLSVAEAVFIPAQGEVS